DDLGGHGGSVEERGPDLDAVAAARSEHFVERHRVADSRIEFLNIDFVASRDTILLPTGFDNCVCHRSLPALRAGKVPPLPANGKRFFKNEKPPRFRSGPTGRTPRRRTRSTLFSPDRSRVGKGVRRERSRPLRDRRSTPPRGRATGGLSARSALRRS